MPPLPRLQSLFRNVFQRRRVERDLDAEVRGYLELLTAEKVASGMSPAEAGRAAAVELGGLEQVKERVREARVGALIDALAQDLRYGARTLARAPGFTAATVTALALGIGATVALFSVVDAVLLRPFPYDRSGRLTVILHGGKNPVAPATFNDLRLGTSAFDRMGAADYWTPNLAADGPPEAVQGLRTTADVLAMLEVSPMLGRLFTTAEEAPGRDRVAVLSHGLWQRAFAADPAVLGRTIRLDGEPHTVLGVMPAGFDFPPFWARGVQVWAPLALGDRLQNRSGQSLRVFARLRPGATLDRARAEVAGVAARLERQYPGTARGLVVRPLQDVVVRNVRAALLVLMGAVGLLLLIACANVAHMLLARATARHREIAVRAALGAGRGRLIRQLLTESVLLGLLGGSAGVLLAHAAVRGLVAMSADVIPRLETVAVSGAVVVFAAAVSVATGLLFGLAPALQAGARDPGAALHEGERGSTEGRAHGRVRDVLVASELALALVLLVGAGLLMRSFLALQAVDPGFDPRNVLSLVVSVTGSSEATPARRLVFYRELVERVRALPGVDAASGINHLPLAGDIWGWPFLVEGEPPRAPGETRTATYRVVLPGYFEAMRLPLLRGRDFTHDDDLGHPGVVIVNEDLAVRHWPGQDPLGKRINLDDPKEPWLTVVGVAKNAVRGAWDAEPEEELYRPYPQDRRYLERASSSYAYVTLVVRAPGEARALASAVRGAVSSLAPDVAVSQVQSMDEVVAEALGRPRFYLLLLGTFAGVAVALAAVGIYGVMSYAVSRRAHEIGIRMALGARPGDVLRLVVGRGMAIVAVGALIGLVGALGLTRTLSTLLFGVRAADPVTFAAVVVGLGAVALAACYLPARRATRIDPLVALRQD